MALKLPESMDTLAYHTRRTLAPKGRVTCWVERERCPKCKKGTMGKPLDPKTKKPKIRATEYECPECKHSVEKEAYEATLTASAVYECPACGKNGEATIPFKRKNINGAATLRFNCQFCKANIDVPKKFKEKGQADPDA